MPRLLRPLAALLALLLGACALPPLDAAQQARLASLLPADALLLGEQHDAPEHQQLQRQVVQWLADRGQLAAVVLEMAEAGHGTAGLPPDASARQVRAALAWDDARWPWRTYGPVIMAAVAAGAPVLGANLSLAQMREAMRQSALDDRLPAELLAVQRQRIRDSHCGLLPEPRIDPMTRVQIARDIAMADAVARAAQQAAPGRVVLLITGNGHVHRALGVPRFLPADLKAKVLSAQAQSAQAAIENEALADRALQAGDLRWPTPPLPPRDPCATLR
ncbi:MAG TPA: ChaN family lipoprotein [Ottowia sp.]|nr:ChaN family lipoprotein [Ottowia sp.]